MMISRLARATLGALMVLIALSAVQPAPAADIAIVAAAASSSTDPRYLDPQAKLMGTGKFGKVDIINAGLVTPTLQELQQYDAIITWSNVNYKDATALGNVFADYVDAGGGVVVAVFANSTGTASRYLTGRWLQGYEVIVTKSGNKSGAATLGTVFEPDHPTMAGVKTFNGGTSGFRPVTKEVTQGSRRIAEWSTGETLVAVGSNSHRVDLGFYPPSSDVVSTYWDKNTDGALLMANALLFSIPEPASLSAFGLGLLLAVRRR